MSCTIKLYIKTRDKECGEQILRGEMKDFATGIILHKGSTLSPF